jgi:hypothetical protein
VNKKLLCLLFVVCLIGCEKEEVEKIIVKGQEEVVGKEQEEDVIKEQEEVIVKEQKEVVVKEKPVEKQPQPVTPVLPKQLSKQEVNALVDMARETQWKVFDSELYTINQVKEMYSPHFTEAFIDRFIFERMTESQVDGETKYSVPGSDDNHLIIWGNAYSWTDKTNIEYYQENNINFIKVSEYKTSEFYGDFVFVIIFKEIDGNYIIENVIYEWE